MSPPLSNQTFKQSSSPFSKAYLIAASFLVIFIPPFFVELHKKKTNRYVITLHSSLNMFTISMIDYQKNKNYVSIHFAWKYFIYIALKLLSKIKFFIKLLFINLSLFISSISFSSICFIPIPSDMSAGILFNILAHL